MGRPVPQSLWQSAMLPEFSLPTLLQSVGNLFSCEGVPNRNATNLLPLWIAYNGSVIISPRQVKGHKGTLRYPDPA